MGLLTPQKCAAAHVYCTEAVAGLGDCAERPLGSLLLQHRPGLCPTLNRLLMYPAEVESKKIQQRVTISIL